MCKNKILTQEWVIIIINFLNFEAWRKILYYTGFVKNKTVLSRLSVAFSYLM